MQLQLTAETESLILQHVQAGHYASPEQVVAAAMRQLGLPANGATPAETPREGGYWRGRVVIAEDFDELPSDLREAFGMTGP